MEPVNPKRKTRKVSEITAIQYGFFIPIQGGGQMGIICDPSSDDIGQAVKNKEFAERGFQSHLAGIQKEWEAGSPTAEEYCRRVKTYHARRIAYFVENGWDGDPIELKPDGSVNDGLHRLKAAKYLGMEEVEIKIAGETKSQQQTETEMSPQPKDDTGAKNTEQV
jgi:hypothetical protein